MCVGGGGGEIGGLHSEMSLNLGLLCVQDILYLSVRESSRGNIPGKAYIGLIADREQFLFVS